MLSLYNDQCVEYHGVCTQHLSHLNKETSLFTLTLNGASEVDIISFIDILKQFSGFINEQCRASVLPFLCQYIYPSCNVTNDRVNFISQMQCSTIRDVVCSAEWR